MKMVKNLAAVVITMTLALTTILTPVSVYAATPTTGSGFTSDMSEVDWCQNMFTTSGLRSGGCRVVAFSKMLAEAGFPVGDPQQYWDWCYNNKVKGYFNKNGYEMSTYGSSLNPYAQANGGSVELVTKVSISGKSKADTSAIIMDYINQGYYCILSCSAHTVYVSRGDSIAAGEPVMHESSYSSNSAWYGNYGNVIKFNSNSYKSSKYTGMRVYKITSPATNANDNSLGQYYILSAVNNRYVLDVYGAGCSSGDNVNIWETNKSDAQKWNLKDAGDGYVYLEPQCAPGYCLDVAGAGTSNKTNVQIWAANGTAAQKWKFVDAGDGSYFIIPQVGDGAVVLDLKGAKATSGTNIQIYQKNDTAAQKWILTRVD